VSSFTETPPLPPSLAPLPDDPDEQFRGPVHRSLYNAGLILKFTGYVLRDTFSGRVLGFLGEVIRQAGILIVSSTVVIWGLIFIIGLQCGIEGAYLLQSQGAPQYAGLFSAWCDLRELAPLTFGYMMAAKVGTGIVAELGSMRISE
jgi:phospholipid/cholesterol/gamma-HCH transport system permease protein